MRAATFNPAALFGAVIASLLLAVCALGASVSAQGAIDPNVCAGVSDSVFCDDHARTQGDERGNNSLFGTNGILNKVVRVFFIIVGIGSTIMVVIGGFKYVLSSGDPGKVTSAKNTIIYAIVGIVIALLAQAIIIFLVNNVG